MADEQKPDLAVVPEGGMFTTANAKRAADMARRAHASRAANLAPEPAEDTDSEEARKRVEALPGRDELADRATAVVLDVLNRVLIGKIKVTGANAKAIAEMAFTIVRLESGDPTSITGKMDRDQIMGQLKGLRDTIEKRQKREAGMA